jgi:heme-degrading monooxygenase HmoA
MVVVVFRSRIRSDADLSGIEEAGVRMYELASAMPGFVSYKEFKAEDGEILSLVEFRSEAELTAWRNHPEHLEIQRIGRERVFERYDITVCAPIRRYSFDVEKGRTERHP